MLRNILNRFVREEKKILGRWSKVNEQQILDYKIHLANSDSCYHQSLYENLNYSNKENKTDKK